jgi:hypothetical protein
MQLRLWLRLLVSGIASAVFALSLASNRATTERDDADLSMTGRAEQRRVRAEQPRLVKTPTATPSPTPTPPTPTPTPTATPGLTPTPTPPGPCEGFRVLIIHADDVGVPTQLQQQIQAESGVTVVDLFDALASTPTMAQLLQYNIVVPFGYTEFADVDTLGNNLSTYADAGGVVVQYGLSFYRSGNHSINGRWLSNNYNPYNYSLSTVLFMPFSLGNFSGSHPLMAGITTLTSNFQNVVTPAAGATQVAAATNGNSLVAFRPITGGHTTVGVTAYVGAQASQTGDWGKLIVNAGRWLLPCTARPTPAPRPRPTPVPRPTP